jgi:hypothetical protein
MPIVAKSPLNTNVVRRKLDRFDSLSAELMHLTDASNTWRVGHWYAGKWRAGTPQRQADALMRRAAKLRTQVQAINAIPEVRAAISKRERSAPAVGA